MNLNKWTEAMRSSELGIESLMAAIEAVLISVVGRVGLWMTPLPSAFLVARSASRVFSLDGVWPVIMAAIVELVGLACSHLWLTAREWNARKTQKDPAANERLAFGLMCMYFVTTSLLLLAFEIPNVLATGNITGLTSLLFPVLSATALVTLNERSMQHKRVSDKAMSKILSKSSKSNLSKTVQDSVQNDGLDAVNAARRMKKAEVLDKLVEVHHSGQVVGATDLAKQLGISRSSLYNYMGELEQAGRLNGKNGNG